MTNGWLFLAITSLICLGVFFNGLRFARMTVSARAGRRLFNMPIEGSDMSVAQVRRIGKLQMLFAPIFWVFSIVLCFGLLGPVEGIETIKF